MMYYVICKGPGAGIYNNFDNALRHLDETSLFSFKSVETLKEARSLIKEVDCSKKVNQGIDTKILKVYTDGSFNFKHRIGGAGALGVYNGKIVFEMSTLVEINEDEEVLKTEVSALKFAIRQVKKQSRKYDLIQFCVDNVSLIDLFSEMPSEKDFRFSVYQMIEELKKSFEVEVVRIKGHNGNLYNERADWLSKEASGVQHKDFFMYDSLKYDRKIVSLGYEVRNLKNKKKSKKKSKMIKGLNKATIDCVIDMILQYPNIKDEFVDVGQVNAYLNGLKPTFFQKFKFKDWYKSKYCSGLIESKKVDKKNYIKLLCE